MSNAVIERGPIGLREGLMAKTKVGKTRLTKMVGRTIGVALQMDGKVRQSPMTNMKAKPVLREKEVDIELRKRSARDAAMRAYSVKPKEDRYEFRGGGKHKTEALVKYGKVLYGYHNMSESIKDFLYEPGSRGKKKKIHTIEEFELYLERLLERCKENRERGLRELAD